MGHFRDAGFDAIHSSDAGFDAGHSSDAGFDAVHSSDDLRFEAWQHRQSGGVLFECILHRDARYRRMGLSCRSAPRQFCFLKRIVKKKVAKIAWAPGGNYNAGEGAI